MNSRSSRIIVALLAVVSLLTTMLVAINVMADKPGNTPSSTGGAAPPTEGQPALRGGVVTPAGRDDPPVLYDVPAFALTNHMGSDFGRDDLQGKVWIAGFIFTRCQTVCPRLTSQMAVLHGKLAKRPGGFDDVMFVSFSVDPEHDTPEVLSGYSELATAHPDSRPFADRWMFLTGERDTIWPLIEGGFRLPVAEAEATSEMPIMHSDRVTLVDKRGRIRGYYQLLGEDGSGDRDEHDRLLTDIEKLKAEPAPTESRSSPDATN